MSQQQHQQQQIFGVNQQPQPQQQSFATSQQQQAQPLQQQSFGVDQQQQPQPQQQTFGTSQQQQPQQQNFEVSQQQQPQPQQQQPNQQSFGVNQNQVDYATQLTLMNSSIVTQRIVDRLRPIYPNLTIDDVKACLAYAQALVEGEDVTPAPRPQRQSGTVQPVV